MESYVLPCHTRNRYFKLNQAANVCRVTRDGRKFTQHKIFDYDIEEHIIKQPIVKCIESIFNIVKFNRSIFTKAIVTYRYCKQ